MNKRITPTPATKRAAAWFSDYLTARMRETNTSAPKLAAAIGLNRKSIYGYKDGTTSPKLEIVARVIEYFGDADDIEVIFIKTFKEVKA